MNKYAVSSLVHDTQVYPRISPDESHVQILADAIAAGAKLPPIVICAKTKRIVDGVHRVQAYQQHNGRDFLVECIEKKYRDNSELLLDAIRLNATHGNPLNVADRKYCQMLSASVGVDMNDLANALGVNPSAIGRLSVAATGKSLSGAYARQNAIIGAQNKQDSTGNKKVSYYDSVPTAKRTIQEVCNKAMRWYDIVNRGEDGDVVDIAQSELFEACRRHRESILKAGARG